MKKVLVLALLPLAASVAHAESDTLVLSGGVDPQCTLQLDAQTSGSVTIGQNTEEHNLGSLQLACNDADGFLFTIDSPNDFFLTDASGEYTYDYALKISGDPEGTLNGQTGNQNDGYSVQVNSFVPAYAIGLTLTVAFDPDENNNNAQAVPGGVSLTDTVTFEISGA